MARKTRRSIIALNREAKRRKERGLPDIVPKSRKGTAGQKKSKTVRETVKEVVVLERLGLKRSRLPSERKTLQDLQDRVDFKLVKSEYKKGVQRKKAAVRIKKRIQKLSSQLEKGKSKLKEQVDLLELLKKKLAKTEEAKSGGGGSGGVIGSGSVVDDGDDDDEVRSVDSDTTCLVNLHEEEEEEEPPKKKKKKKKIAVITAVKKTRIAPST
jgi:hypothetical protein